MSNDKKNNVSLKNNKPSHAEILKARGTPLPSGKLTSLKKRQRRIDALIKRGAQLSGILPKGTLRPTGSNVGPGEQVTIITRTQIQEAEKAFENMLAAKYGGM